MKEADAKRLVEGLMRSYGLHDWKFGWCGGFGGYCNFGAKKICVSRKVARDYDSDVVSKTALHEIAHALAGPAAGHGPKWKAMARRIGGYDTPRAQLPPRMAAQPRTGWSW